MQTSKRLGYRIPIIFGKNDQNFSSVFLPEDLFFDGFAII